MFKFALGKFNLTKQLQKCLLISQAEMSRVSETCKDSRTFFQLCCGSHIINFLSEDKNSKSLSCFFLFILQQISRYHLPKRKRQLGNPVAIFLKQTCKKFLRLFCPTQNDICGGEMQSDKMGTGTSIFANFFGQNPEEFAKYAKLLPWHCLPNVLRALCYRISFLSEKTKSLLRQHISQYEFSKRKRQL